MNISLWRKLLLTKCQNLSEQFPHLITDLATVCFEAFQKADPDETLTLLVHQASYLGPFPAKAASVIPLHDIQQQIRGIIKKIVTLHPQRRRLGFTFRHDELIRKYSLGELSSLQNSSWNAAASDFTSPDCMSLP